MNTFTKTPTFRNSRTILFARGILSAVLFWASGFLFTAEAAPALQRPVYVGNVTPTAITINWKSTTGGTSVVNYGTTVSYGSAATGASGFKTVDNSPGYLHSVTVTGLTPDTRYYYQVSTSGTTLSPGGDTSFTFKTAPVKGASSPFTFAIFGDSDGDTGIAAQFAAKKPDFVLNAGDIVYPYGGGVSATSEGRQDARYYDIYQGTLKNTPYYITCGNHDAWPNGCDVRSGDTGKDVMDQENAWPGGGKMGGVNTTYSFDYGNVHFVSLNSETNISYNSSNPSASAAQIAWAYNDLKNSTQPWKIVYWHNNAWSAGSHSYSAGTLDNLVSLCEDVKANICFWGHSHVYERWPAERSTSGFYTIGNGGRKATTACLTSGSGGTSLHPARKCLAASGGETGFLFVTMNNTTSTWDYYTSAGSKTDTATYTTSGTPPPTDTTAPTVPTGLAATAISSSQINLSWTASTDNVGVTGYKVFRNGTQIATVTGTSYSNTGLSPSTTYTYAVSAYDAAGNNSAQSASKSATTLAGSDTIAPSVPTGLSATAISSSQINLAWTASTDNVGVTGYRLERCQGTGCTSFAQIATPTGTTYSNTGLSASTVYVYRVRAVDAAGNLSGYSGTASATTLAGTPPEGALIRTINTSAWVPPSPDPAGIAYLPSGEFLIADSEVDEMGIYAGANIYRMSKAGTLLSTSNTLCFSAEPTGIGYNPNNKHFFITDDNLHKVFERDIGTDGRFCTADDIVIGSFGGIGAGDLEDVTYDMKRNVLYVLESAASRIYTVAPGSDGIFNGVGDSVTSFDVSGLGLSGPEGILYDSASDSIYVFARVGKVLGQITTSGTFIRWIDVSAAPIVSPGGVTLGPSSINPGVLSVYLVDRGIDNDPVPTENDGKIYEMSLGGTAPPPTDTTPPTVPAGLAATAISSSQINLAWTASTDNVGVTGYRLERCQGTGCTSFAQIATPTGTTYSNTGLSASTVYVYRVRAVDAAGNLSGYSGTASATTPTDTVLSGNLANSATYIGDSGNFRSDRQPSALWDGCYEGTFDVVQPCTAGNANIGSFYVNFDLGKLYNLSQARLFGDADGVWVSKTWKLEYKKNSSDAWTTAFSGVNAFMNAWSSKSLAVQAQFVRLTVVGVSGAGTQAREFELSGTVVGGGGDITAPSVTLTAPAGGATVSGTINITAIASDNVGVVGVQFRRDGADFGAEDTTAPYSIPWDTTGVANGSHTVGAIARDAAGNTKGAGPITITVNNTTTDGIAPTIPTGLVATTISSSQINLAWTASTDNVGVTGYKIFRNGTQIATVTGTSYPDTGLSPSTTYTYAVSAYDAAGNNSAQSASKSATTLSGGGTTGGTLTFQPVADATIVKGSPDSNFGSNSTLELDASSGVSTYESLLKFTVTGLSGRAVKSATLRLYNINSSNSGGSFYRVANSSWTESGVTWNNAPAADTTALGTLGSVANGIWYDVNVTPLIVGDGTYSIRVRSISSDGADYSSKEGVNKPQLVVVFEGSDTTAPTVPTGLVATVISSSIIDLAWTASTDNIGVTGYKIFRNGTQIATVTGTSYPDTGLSPSTTYTYTVSAYDAAGNNSAQSASKSATTESGTVLSGNLANSATYIGDSGNFRSDRQPSALWDGCYEGTFDVVQPCTAGNANIGSFYVNFDLGKLYNLSQARLFGDADGVWVSKTWKLEYKKNSSDAWTTAFSGVNAFANAWSSKSLAVQAQFVRLTVVGVSGGTQAREFELFGTAVSGGGGDTIAPTVSISAPLSGATVSGTIAVTATANDNIGVVGVQFKLDGANLGTEDTTAPYSTSWNTAGVANGSHTLTAVARDAAGNTKVSTAVSVTVNNATTDTTPPSVSITSPTFDVTVSGTITVTATASDNVGVAGVQFKIDGINLGSEDTTSPYSASWNTAAGTNGFHTVAAVARDTAGNVTTSSGVRVTVSNGVSSMTTITLTGTSASRYSKSISSDTLFDATQYTNTSVSISPKNGVAVDITGDTGAQHIIWRGGVIIGSIPTTWTWRQAHDDIGGSGVTIHNNGLAEWQYLRVHNVEDGLKPRENPEYSNGSRFLVRDCYMTAIRDDSIESDRYEPGTVQDCLFDGVFTFISEQNENVGTNDPIGPSEDDTIYIKRVYVRLYPTNAFDGGVEDKYHGGGRWFKWMPRGTTNHKLAVSDSVFAVGAIPRLGWSNLDVPPEVTWVGANNFILWLGTPGAYGGPKPAGVTFLEGQPAKDKWVAVRNKWLTDHGLPAQTFAADYDPFSAPLQQIPISGGGSTDTIAPTVPTGLSATAISSSQINLAWTASTDNVGVTGYKVFRGGVQIATVTGTSYSNTGLSPSTTYTYTVSAYDAAGNNSAQSASKSATTQSGTVTVKAFPTAEGFGAVSIGGRGGKVIEVTNLNDTGTGSLRACVEASGPRTCVFRTGGTITVNSRLNISSPYLTIAGQTAPGGGIALRSDPSNGKGIIQLNSSAHDVIIRYIRVRPGTPSSSTDTGDGITINSDRVILDHVSVSWAIDENVNSWYSTAHDITVQWSILSEGLHCSVHPKGCHSKAAIFGSQEAHSVSMHHTLMAHNDDRHPETKLRTGGVTDLVNNLIYNFGKVAVRISDEYGKSPTNYVGNYVKKGPSSSSSYDIQYYNASGQGTTIYSQGNIGPYRTSTSQPEENVVRPEDRKFIVSARHPAPQVITTSAMEAYNNVLANAGARLPVRDSVDQRIVNDVKNGTGKIINHESEVGGYPTLAAGTPVADSDHDGMSDAWESSHGLSSSDASDGAKTSSNGYTNLENYLNTLAGDI